MSKSSSGACFGAIFFAIGWNWKGLYDQPEKLFDALMKHLGIYLGAEQPPRGTSAGPAWCRYGAVNECPLLELVGGGKRRELEMEIDSL